MQGQLIENLKVVSAAVPKDTTGAVVAGDWVNLKNFRRCLVVIAQGAWAGGTPALTFEQGTDASGAGAKALAYTVKYQGVALTDDIYDPAAVTGNTSNLAAAANSVTLVEFYATDLDVNNNFTWLHAAIASPGANADLIAVLYILGDPRTAQKPANQVTVIA